MCELRHDPQPPRCDIESHRTDTMSHRVGLRRYQADASALPGAAVASGDGGAAYLADVPGRSGQQGGSDPGIFAELRVYPQLRHCRDTMLFTVPRVTVGRLARGVLAVRRVSGIHAAGRSTLSSPSTCSPAGPPSARPFSTRTPTRCSAHRDPRVCRSLGDSRHRARQPDSRIEPSGWTGCQLNRLPAKQAVSAGTCRNAER